MVELFFPLRLLYSNANLSIPVSRPTVRDGPIATYSRGGIEQVFYFPGHVSKSAWLKRSFYSVTTVEIVINEPSFCHNHVTAFFSVEKACYDISLVLEFIIKFL